MHKQKKVRNSQLEKKNVIANKCVILVEYTDDATLIPKNTSLIIARIPLARQPKKAWDPTADKGQSRTIQNESDSTNVDLSRMNGSEEDKINAMMIQSTMDYDPNK